MAPRASWSGHISWGMISIPVKMFTAIESANQLSFRQLHKGTNAPIKQKRVDAVTGDEVPFEEITKGYEVAKDTFIEIDPEEIDELLPDKTSAITVEAFVPVDDIDPIYLDKPYLLGTEGGEKPYSLLRRAMEKTGKIAIGRMVMRNREHLVAIRPSGEGLTVSTLHWHEQIRDVSSVAPPPVEVSEKEVLMASQLVESYSGDFDLSELHDTYTAQVMELIEAKAEGKEVTVVRETSEEDLPEDLEAALMASLEAARTQREAM